MHLRWLAPFCLAAVTCAAPARAVEIQIPSSAMTGTDAAGAELVSLYLDLCLNRFPDDAAVDAGVAQRKRAVMPPEALKQHLHDDPGRGWFVKTDSAVYDVTIEAPPFHTCAVRSRYKAAPKYALAYQLMTKTWAANAKLGPLQELPPQHLPKDGMDISATMMGLPAGNGQKLQRFMAFTTTYPNGEVEIRLVRQFPPDHP